MQVPPRLIAADDNDAATGHPVVASFDSAAPGHDQQPASALVWDLPVRVFHWATVCGVLTAWFSAGTGHRLHEIAGFAVLALLIFRVIWGITGTRHARFGDFVPTPKRMLAYLNDMRLNRAARYLGHNPAGGAMIIALLLFIAIISVSGMMMMTNRFFGVEWVETLHHYAANGLMFLVPLHILGVIVGTWMHQENLIGSMFTGRKAVHPGDVMVPIRGQPADEMTTRLYASQGFTTLMFLIAGGLFFGWASTNHRTAIVPPDAAAPTQVVAVAAVAVPAVAVVAAPKVEIKEKQDYVVSGPEDASPTWFFSSGGRLYDNWFLSLDKKGPAETHPSWPKANTTMSGEQTWRCKSCHGWDYMGREGQYASGPNATGVIGVQRARGRDPAVITKILGNDTHRFTEELIPEHAKYRLALFLSQGQHIASQIVLPGGRIKGNPEAGKALFQNVCAACHGFDGRGRKLGASSDKADAGYAGSPLFVGTKANANPIEVLHKIRNGHPGAIMVSLRPFPMDVAANVLAYAKTLPVQ